MMSRVWQVARQEAGTAYCVVEIISCLSILVFFLGWPDKLSRTRDELRKVLRFPVTQDLDQEALYNHVGCRGVGHGRQQTSRQAVHLRSATLCRSRLPNPQPAESVRAFHPFSSATVCDLLSAESFEEGTRHAICAYMLSNLYDPLRRKASPNTSWYAPYMFVGPQKAPPPGKTSLVQRKTLLHRA